MSDTKYNGWTNYETWNWKLWIDNDQGLQEYWLETAQSIADTACSTKHLTKEQSAWMDLADALKADCEERLELTFTTLSGPFTDILGCALERINWREVAESLIEDCKELA